MMGKGNLENREHAFRAYKSCGGNVDAAMRELARHAVPLLISKKTFYEWIEKYNFKGRLKATDEAVAQAADMTDHYREKMLVDLKRQKDRYDVFFKSIEPQIDNQATYAYNSLCKTISAIQMDIEGKPELYRMAPIVMDSFVQFVKSAVKEADLQETIFGLIDRFFDEVKPDA